jgi:hypothetical protein
VRIYFGVPFHPHASANLDRLAWMPRGLWFLVLLRSSATRSANTFSGIRPIYKIGRLGE